MKDRKNPSTILKEIKQEYRTCQDSLDPEPKILKIAMFFIVIFAICLIFTIIISLNQLSPNIIVWGILFFVGFFVSILAYYVFLRRYKVFYMKKNEDITTLCKMIIADEASEYNVSGDELAIYLMQNYRKHKRVLYLLVVTINILSVAFAVYYLPGYNQIEQSIGSFIALVLLNLLVSFLTSRITRQMWQLDELDFFVIRPYGHVFDQIEQANNYERASVE